MNKWRLFAPAEDWLHPIEIEESELPLLATVGERLGLRVGRNDAQRKFFLGLPTVPKTSSGGEGVTYPSGLSIPKAVLSVAEAARYGTTGIYTAAPLLAARASDKLSQHFSAGEFYPGDSSYRFLRISAELIRRLEKIRTALGGVAITVHSAYRPPEYNRLVGGVSNSAHIDGLAADISAAGISTEALRRVCEVIIGDDGGVGFYPSQEFCHIDVRGYGSRWNG
ncbi:MAG: DUF882 domain-containing protein [Candidatus Eremiobacteraeota bacterium]|nr:DUF882 domain-containing protein [Candidatus Eremiobacteraeota bacterium]MCW5871384.1 DUF882 domain-containing protein [Candidatus Eremiobacteraeota bacterium]